MPSDINHFASALSSLMSVFRIAAHSARAYMHKSRAYMHK
jgi:hypothetical protein